MRYFRYGIAIIGSALLFAPDFAEAQTHYPPPPQAYPAQPAAPVQPAPAPSTTVVVPPAPAPVYSPYGVAGHSRRVSRRTSRRVSRRH